MSTPMAMHVRDEAACTTSLGLIGIPKTFKSEYNNNVKFSISVTTLVDTGGVIYIVACINVFRFDDMAENVSCVLA